MLGRGNNYLIADESPVLIASNKFRVAPFALFKTCKCGLISNFEFDIIYNVAGHDQLFLQAVIVCGMFQLYSNGFALIQYTS
jgi:hypothetical protein